MNLFLTNQKGLVTHILFLVYFLQYKYAIIIGIS